ncbi:hypothetical protein D3C73_505400 [compost metagenome]
MSVIGRVVVGDVFPASSVKVTFNSPVSVWGGSRSIRNVPPLPTTPLPTTMPSASVTLTMAPGSPSPKSSVLSGLASSPVGAPGGVRSGVATGTGSVSLLKPSVRVTSSPEPSFCAGESGMVKVPLAPTVPVHSSVPLVTVTVDPTSPRPVICVPSALTLRLVGKAGGVSSTEVMTPGADELPSSSVRTTCRLPPSICAGLRGTLKEPSVPTSAEPTCWPAALVTITVAPGSPVPFRTVPPASTLRPLGAAGGVASVVGTVPGSEMLPLPSVRTTVRSPPSIWAGLRPIVNVPSGPIVPVPTVSPAALVTVTVVPISPEPVRTVPAPFTARFPGWSGSVMSGAVTVTGSDAFPSPSVRTTVRSPPSDCAGLSGMLIAPVGPTMPVPTTSPASLVTVTVAPASPWPVSVVPPLPTVMPVGASGPTRSGDGARLGSDVLP